MSRNKNARSMHKDFKHMNSGFPCVFVTTCYKRHQLKHIDNYITWKCCFENQHHRWTQFVGGFGTGQAERRPWRVGTVYWCWHVQKNWIFGQRKWRWDQHFRKSSPKTWDDLSLVSFVESQKERAGPGLCFPALTLLWGGFQAWVCAAFWVVIVALSFAHTIAWLLISNIYSPSLRLKSCDVDPKIFQATCSFVLEVTSG